MRFPFAIPLADVEDLSRSPRVLATGGLVCVACLLLIWSTYAAGRSRGMDRVIAFGPESDEAAIAVALSESLYGLDLGYIGYTSVYDAIDRVVHRGSKDRYDAVVQNNVSDGRLLNEALSAAASLGPQTPGSIAERTLMTTLVDDQGMVDFVKLSFRFFDRRIESLYKTFFVLLAISAGAFLLSFWNSPAALVVLVCSLLSFLVELETPLFNSYIPTFVGLRHGSALCLVPMWHFAFLTLDARRVSWVSLALALVQAAILVLTIRVRGSSMWAVFFLLGLAVVCYARRRQHVGDERSQSIRGIRAWWPAIVVVIGLVANQAYMAIKLHPVYFTDDIMPYHPLWHSAYLGFGWTPELYGFTVPTELIMTDELGQQGAAKYMRDIHLIGKDPVGYLSPWTGTQKFRLHDGLMRRAVFRVALAHPLQTLKLYVMKKPRAIWGLLSILLRGSTPLLFWFIAGGAVCTAMIWLTAGSTASASRTLAIAAISGCAFLASLLPNMWAYPAPHTISDGLLSLLATITICSGVAVALCVRWLASAVSDSLSGRRRRQLTEN